MAFVKSASFVPEQELIDGHVIEYLSYFQDRLVFGPLTRIRFRTPRQMKAQANTTSEQSNKKVIYRQSPIFSLVTKNTF